ncbi:plasmid mobilization protein [Leifsonia xyli]|uniref:plasmid mobilization protein n=1 Tax=Leifsonia xyli TaxID=1575 RepID=UPI000AEB500A|nr:plasmid mobilization relaxosome protein MobC [Leifsonia xyli]
MEAVNRSRPVRKILSFSAAEWERVERRIRLVGARSFEAFARQVVLEGEVRVTAIAFDPAEMRVALSRIGNNVNQIAALANTEENATFEQVQAVRKLLVELQGVVTHAVDTVEARS